MAKKEEGRKRRRGEPEPPVDLASRIGARSEPATKQTPPASSAAPPEPPTPLRHDGPLPPRRAEAARPTTIGAGEPFVAPPRIEPEPDEERSAPIPSPRQPPGVGETDLVVTPLPTPDDWHRFELALRKVRGVGQLRTEYYRHGVLKMRVSHDETERLAHLLRAGVPGYRVRVIGEDRSTLQILVASENEERKPG